MLRTIVASFTLLLLAAAAGADVIVLKKDRKVVGIKSDLGNGLKVDADNVELFLDQSTGIIDREGYDGVDFKKSEKAKKVTTYPWSQIEKVLYSTEPDALLDGYDQMQLGAYAQAIGAFNEVLESDARLVFKNDAKYRISICYLQAGNIKTAMANLASWTGGNSVYTPEVKRLLAEIYTSRKQYVTARDQYNQIAALPGIPPNWQFRAKLGNVKVDIAERKHKEAEDAAKRIASQTGNNDELADAHALALILQAEAVLMSDATDRLPEAEATLRKAAGLKGVSATNRANLFATLGDVLYKQGNLEAARFPYMRVATMYSAEAGYVAHCLQNAGQCFLDMSGRELDKDRAKSDEYLVHAMKLFAQCAARYRGSEPGRAAAIAYRANKARYEELKEDKEG